MERRTASEYRSAVFRTKSAERTERHAAAKRVPLRRARAASEHFEQLPDKTHRLRREQPSCCGAAMKPSVRKERCRQVRPPASREDSRRIRRGIRPSGHIAALFQPIPVCPQSPDIPGGRRFSSGPARAFRERFLRSEAPRSADLFHAVPRSVSCGTAKAPPADAAPDSNPPKRRMHAKALKKAGNAQEEQKRQSLFLPDSRTTLQKGNRAFLRSPSPNPP